MTNIEQYIKTWKKLLSQTSNAVSETYIEMFIKDLKSLKSIEQPNVDRIIETINE
jgi:hypothetical protein